MAAAIGRSFSIEVLDGACRAVPASALLEALEEADGAPDRRGGAGAPGRYAFAHALIRETLYASLSGPRRVALHRAIGAILEQQHAGDPDPPLGELAYHFVEAAEPGAAAKAVDYSARAARRALAALAYEEAASHFERALEALALSGVARRARPTATCCSASASPTARRASSIRAAPPSRPPPTSRGPPASGSTSRARRSGSREAGSSRAPPTRRSSRCSKRRSPRCPTPTTALRARLLGRLAMELHFSGEPERCQTLARQSVTLARQLRDPVDARVRAQRSPLGAARPRRGRRAARDR